MKKKEESLFKVKNELLGKGGFGSISKAKALRSLEAEYPAETFNVQVLKQARTEKGNSAPDLEVAAPQLDNPSDSSHDAWIKSLFL